MFALPDPNFFEIRDVVIAGADCVLVFPKNLSAPWTRDNLIFRSSIWTKAGEPVSLGFKKFFNWTEQSELIPEPTSFQDVECMEKIDGSALIVSKFRGQLIVRTRGTIDARKMDKNGHEIDELIARYPKAFENTMLSSENYSFIYEWTSPLNRIVLDYGAQATIRLIGVISHSGYTMLQQDELDVIAKEIGVPRPQHFAFSDFSDMIATVKAFKGIEGVCVYFNQGQDIKKLKGIEYLALHAFKAECSLEKMVDMYADFGFPSYQDALAKLQETFDFECMQMAQPFLSKICDAMRQVREIEAGLRGYADKMRGLPRKDAALKIMASYGNTARSGFVFTFLDGKDLDAKQMKKLLWQCLKV